MHADARLRVTGTGRRRRTTNSYWVVMSDPPIPAHDAVVAVAEAERYLHAAGTGADWHVPEGVRRWDTSGCPPLRQLEGGFRP